MVSVAGLSFNGVIAGMLDSVHQSPLVSVIVPVFNAENFLERCLDSIFAQTMPDFEVIAVNDGSTDSSLQLLREFEAKHHRLTIIDQANAGQGAARNRALQLAQGEFVLFVDADDFIERVTLQVTTERAIEDGSDLVHFDWKLYTPGVGRPGDVHYYNADPFWHKRILLGAECDELLRVQNFYSVTNLYRRSFLEAHEIFFEEGRIYEDNPFVLQAVNRAQIASLVHSPLYTIDPHPDSSTRSNTESDKHVRDHLHAVRRTFELLEHRNPRASAYLAAYHIKKFGPYYEKRIPKRFRSDYAREFVEILHQAQISIPSGTSTNAPTRLAMRLEIFERRRAHLFKWMIAGKNIVMPRYKRAKRALRAVKRKRTRAGAWSAAVERALAKPILPGTISFIGLDYKYTGNSRYLFEEIIADPRFQHCEIRFVTLDDRVSEKFRLAPGDVVTKVHLARTELLIAESWIPQSVRKHRDSTWVQLWHGTPIKRMLFDSHEPRIIWNRRHHKTSKYRDIQNWDYFVVDSPLAADLFETAFLLEPRRFTRSGYPRVEYLKRSQSNKNLRDDFRKNIAHGVTNDTKIVLYAPTWRDVNYGRAEVDSNFDYVVDVAALADQLGDEYVVVFHNHGYMPTKLARSHPRCIDVSGQETQELLLAADVLITDYSSLLFDAQAVGMPVVLFAPDQNQFEEFRGLYSHVWKNIQYSCVQASNETLADGVLKSLHSRNHGEAYSRYESDGLTYEAPFAALARTELPASNRLEEI